MKQFFIKLGGRIDALSLRERAMVFAAAAASIVFVVYFFWLNPLFAKQTALRNQISQQQNNIAGIDAEITAKVQAYAVDPDAAGRERLAQVRAETTKMATELRAMEKGLIAPERIAPLLETILRANGKLQLASLKTLPVTALGGEAEDSKAPKAPELLYRHGVELTVRGNYLDMINYMGTLESMPTQLFWGKAQLQVEQYPTSRLTLTLYTLSLERKWLQL